VSDATSESQSDGVSCSLAKRRMTKKGEDKHCAKTQNADRPYKISDFHSGLTKQDYFKVY